jgi:hypothetical protein
MSQSSDTEGFPRMQCFINHPSLRSELLVKLAQWSLFRAGPSRSPSSMTTLLFGEPFAPASSRKLIGKSVAKLKMVKLLSIL